MHRAIVLCVACFSSLILSCDSTTWPTEEEDILDVLAREKNLFLEIEAQMRADNIRFVSEFDLEQASGEPVPSMAHLILKIQFDKYRALLGVWSPYIFEVSDTTFSVAVPDRSSNTSKFLVWLKRDSTQTVRRTCTGSITRLPCGECAIQVDDEWSVHWNWVPHDPTYTDEHCPASRRIR